MSKSTAKADSKASQSEPLKWEVFVTPGIPIAARDRPPGVQETYFQAMASTLVIFIGWLFLPCRCSHARLIWSRFESGQARVCCPRSPARGWSPRASPAGESRRGRL